MADIKRTTEGLEHCLARYVDGLCDDCPYMGEIDRSYMIPMKCKEIIMRDALELLKEQPKWIPVTERKPKSMANKVIVYVEHEDLNPQIGYGHYEKFQGVEMWYNLETQEQFSEHGYTVTHWMPMPKSLDGKRLILD